MCAFEIPPAAIEIRTDNQSSMALLNDPICTPALSISISTITLSVPALLVESWPPCTSRPLIWWRTLSPRLCRWMLSSAAAASWAFMPDARCPRRPQGCRARSAAKGARGDVIGPGIRALFIKTSGRSSCSRELDVWSCRGFGSSPNAHRLRADS
eukprot:150521-Chlamydomonas_euryale.AAC.1